jgi:dihydrofolate reductase
MRRIVVFNMVTLDGFFVDRQGDMSWAHRNDPEWNEFVGGNASGNGMLLFGRVTYEMMAGFWPSPMALEQMPVVAKGMNELPKAVFSRTLREVTWNNTKLVKGDLAEEIQKMKKEPGPDMVILGSGSIVSQLTEHKLIDEYQFVITPTVLGKGRTMFETVNERQTLKRTNSRTFGNGNVFVCYEPAA